MSIISLEGLLPPAPDAHSAPLMPQGCVDTSTSKVNSRFFSLYCLYVSGVSITYVRAPMLSPYCPCVTSRMETESPSTFTPSAWGKGACGVKGC